MCYTTGDMKRETFIQHICAFDKTSIKRKTLIIKGRVSFPVLREVFDTFTFRASFMELIANIVLKIVLQFI